MLRKFAIVLSMAALAFVLDAGSAAWAQG